MSVTRYDYIPTKDVVAVEPGEVSPEMAPVVDSVVRTFRCKVGVRETTEPNHNLPHRTPLHFFYDDCPLAIGTMGFGRVQESTNDYFFYVDAPTISNNRYADLSSQHHMAMSKNADKALANAKRYLRRPNVFECANFYWRRETRDNFKRTEAVESNTLRDLRGGISNNDDVLRELEYMHLSGYAFQSAKLAEQVDRWLAHRDEVAHTKTQRGSEVVYVYAKPDGSIDACRFLVTDWCVEPHDNTEQLREVSQDVQRRIAALTICEDSSHVDLVGTRIANNCFFVYA
jgi:hypothetical protein